MIQGRTYGQYTVLSPIEMGARTVMVAQQAAQAGFSRLAIIESLFPDEDLARHREHLSPTRVAASLQHPNVRQIHEIGSANGEHFIAFEYLEGVTIDHLLRHRNRDSRLTDPRLYCALLAQACEGVHHGHTRLNLVHGSLRPPTLMVTAGGTVKVLDLGLTDLTSATADTDALAEPRLYAYTAPEKILGRPVDFRADIFSLGVIAWEALTSRRLFAQPSRIDVYRAITEREIPPVRALSPNIPEILDDMIAKALAKDPEERFKSAREFGQALEDSVNSIGAPLSTIAIASVIDRAFSEDLESQRSSIQRARQALIKTGDDDDSFDVPTMLFDPGGDPIAATAELNRQMGGSPYTAFEGESLASSVNERPRSVPKTRPAQAGGAEFGRPPDTLSDVTEGPAIAQAIHRDFVAVPTAPAQGQGAFRYPGQQPEHNSHGHSSSLPSPQNPALGPSGFSPTNPGQLTARNPMGEPTAAMQLGSGIARPTSWLVIMLLLAVILGAAVALFLVFGR